jgi:hypothetical protein
VARRSCRAEWLSEDYDGNDDEEAIVITFWISGWPILTNLRGLSQASASVWVLREEGFEW